VKIMDSKIWRATGSYTKKKRKFVFSRELLADRETHVKEKVYSEIGSRHKVRRNAILFDTIVEIKPDEITNLDLKRLLGVETEI